MKQENLPNQKCIFCNNPGGRKMIEGLNKKTGEKVFAHHLCLEIANCTLPMRKDNLSARIKSESSDFAINKKLSGFQL